MNRISYIAIIFTLTATPLIGQDDPLRDQLEEERAETYKSESEDRREYYEATNPKRNADDPEYFEKSHAIKARGLPENRIRSNPIPPSPIEGNPIPSNPIE